MSLYPSPIVRKKKTSVAGVLVRSLLWRFYPYKCCFGKMCVKNIGPNKLLVQRRFWFWFLDTMNSLKRDVGTQSVRFLPSSAPAPVKAKLALILQNPAPTYPPRIVVRRPNLLLATCYSLLTCICYLLLATCYLLFASCYLLLPVCYLILATYYI